MRENVTNVSLRCRAQSELGIGTMNQCDQNFLRYFVPAQLGCLFHRAGCLFNRRVVISSALALFLNRQCSLLHSWAVYVTFYCPGFRRVCRVLLACPSEVLFCGLAGSYWTDNVYFGKCSTKGGRNAGTECNLSEVFFYILLTRLLARFFRHCLPSIWPRSALDDAPLVPIWNARS